MPALCKCGNVRSKHVSNSNFAGREFYKCNDCGAFEWADDKSSRPIFDQAVGPLCNCKNPKATVQRTVKKETSPNRGKKFWACATYPGGCRFFKLLTEEELASCSPFQKKKATNIPDIAAEKDSIKKKRPALPGYAVWLSDWKRLELVQKMMAVDPEKMAHASKSRSEFTYDKLKVVGLWHITNPSKMETFEAAKHHECEKIADTDDITVDLSERYGFSKEYCSIINQLGSGNLEQRIGEVFLLHGTKPTKLHSILFEGLDPEVARNGNFGRGVYFAENAAKVDQYAIVDERYDSSEGPLHELHNQIYSGCRHPNHVRYALVSRVILGKHVTTKDGSTQFSAGEHKKGTKGRPLFKDKRNTSLADLEDSSTPSSLIGIPGDRVRTFREFVVFNADQIFVEYLVAYHRERSLCDCGLEVSERTVSVQTVNYGRKIHLCGGLQQSGEKKCNFSEMFPLCKCGRSASIQTSHSSKNPDKKYYCCYKRGCYNRGQRRKKNKECGFFEWKGSSTFKGASRKKCRTENTSS